MDSYPLNETEPYPLHETDPDPLHETDPDPLHETMNRVALKNLPKFLKKSMKWIRNTAKKCFLRD